MITVRLAAVDNPDFPGDTRGNAPDFEVAVATLEEASAQCRKYIVDHGLGSGNWAGGDVFNAHGTRIAKISYNGRIWPVE